MPCLYSQPRRAYRHRAAARPLMDAHETSPPGVVVVRILERRAKLGRVRCLAFPRHESLQVRRRLPQALHDVGQVHRPAVPSWHRLLAGDHDACVFQVFDQLSSGVEADRRRRRTLFERPSARVDELHGAVLANSHAESAFVEQAVVAAAQQHEVRELRFAAVGPVDDVVRVTVLRGTAREAATPVAELQSAPDRRWNRAGLAVEAEDLACSVPHRDLGGVTRDASGCFRGNVYSACLRRNAAPAVNRGSVHRGLELRFVDVKDHLVAVTARPRIEPALECTLGNQGESVGVTLREQKRSGGSWPSTSPCSRAEPNLSRNFSD